MRADRLRELRVRGARDHLDLTVHRTPPRARLVAVEVETLVDRPPGRPAVAPERPADRDQRAARTIFREAEARVHLPPEAEVERGERGAEPHRPAGEEHVLHRGHQRLELGLAAPRVARDEEVHRHLVEVLGEPDRGALHAPGRLGKGRVLRRLAGRRDVALEALPVALRHEGPRRGVVHRDELPGLAVASARREGARLADLADQRAGHRIRPQTPDRARGADALEERQILPDPTGVDLHAAPPPPAR